MSYKVKFSSCRIALLNVFLRLHQIDGEIDRCFSLNSIIIYIHIHIITIIIAVLKHFFGNTVL